MTIAIDFDGTVVTHQYPDVGKDIGAAPVLRELVDRGHKLILYTMRSGAPLDEAVKWFTVNGINLYGVQYHPTQAKWTCSNKCYANLYIDDAALGVPLIPSPDPSGRPYVDWVAVKELLRLRGYL